MRRCGPERPLATKAHHGSSPAQTPRHRVGTRSDLFRRQGAAQPRWHGQVGGSSGLRGKGVSPLRGGRVPGTRGEARRAPAGGRCLYSGGTRGAYMPVITPLVSMSVRLPRKFCSSSKALNSELKLPAPKPWSGREEVRCGPRKPVGLTCMAPWACWGQVVPGGCGAE